MDGRFNSQLASLGFEPQAGRPLLLDTNLLSPEKRDAHGDWSHCTLIAASTSAQEVLGMQRSDREHGYKFALPYAENVGRAFHHRPEEFVRWAITHSRRRPVSKHTDRLVVSKSPLRPEAEELGHGAISSAHELGQDRIFSAYASSALRGKKLQRVIGKWKFLRSHIAHVVPLDGVIAEAALALAGRFAADGHTVKGTARNTMNDMYVAATALTLELVKLSV